MATLSCDLDTAVMTSNDLDLLVDILIRIGLNCMICLGDFHIRILFGETRPYLKL